MKPAIFSISSLGLGHATRTLPIMRAYLATHTLHIISTGNALAFLQQEFQKEATESLIQFYDIKDYPALERGSGWRFYVYLLADCVRTIFIIKKEQAFVKKLVADIHPEFIISDGRYGSYSKKIPSFLISHQISFSMPRGLGVFKRLADWFNAQIFKKFTTLIIPDYVDESLSLAGKLSHHPMLGKINHLHVGILSSLQKTEGVKGIEYLFTISGYLLEHKASFVSHLIEQAKQLPGKKVFILGNTGEKVHEILTAHDIEIYASVSGDLRQKLFNRAKYVVSRSGYTTIMDLVELDVPGFLIPTPGQTEQEYLAQYLGDKKHFHIGITKVFSTDLLRLSLVDLTAFNPESRTAESVEKIKALVAKHLQPLFFSIIIPAHNEEKYIRGTLDHIKNLDYPQHRFEVIVVENGSTDTTLAIAKSYESPNFRVIVSGKGVSRAKNHGLDHIVDHSDWTVLLDADTELKPQFLQDLNLFLKQRIQKNLVMGTTEVQPYGNRSLYARAWFIFYNVGHWLTHASFAIQIVKSSIGKKIRFHEHRSFAEDLEFLKEACRHGKFCYVPTKQVYTSTRRFDEVGWITLFIKWNYGALVSSRTKKQTGEYRVIR